MSKTPLSMRQQLALIRAMEENDQEGVEPEHSVDDKRVSAKTPSGVGESVGRSASTPAEVRLARRLRRINAKGETQLHRAAIRGARRAAEALLRLGADPNAMDHAHWTPLHEASNHGHLGVAKALVQFGADVNVRGGVSEQETPLHDAAKNGHLRVAVFLVSQGAEVDARKSDGDTPLDLAERYGENPGLVRFLREAESRSNAKEIEARSEEEGETETDSEQEEDFWHFLGLQSSPGLEVALSKMRKTQNSQVDPKKNGLRKKRNREKWVCSPLKDCNNLDRRHKDGRPKRKVAKARLIYNEEPKSKESVSPLKKIAKNDENHEPKLRLTLNVKDAFVIDSKASVGRTLCQQPSHHQDGARPVVEEEMSKTVFKMERIVYPKTPILVPTASEHVISAPKESKGHDVDIKDEFLTSEEEISTMQEKDSGPICASEPEGTQEKRESDRNVESKKIILERNPKESDDLHSKFETETDASIIPKESEMTAPNITHAEDLSLREAVAQKNENVTDTDPTHNHYIHKKQKACSLNNASVFPRSDSLVSNVSLSSRDMQPRVDMSSDIGRRMRLNQIIWERKRSLFSVLPKPPEGFDDYLMNKKTYLLHGNVSIHRKAPTLTPSSLCTALKTLFKEQEEERTQLRERHQVEREKLILCAEQEILRIHNKAALAIANQRENLSFCTMLRLDNTYKLEPEPEQVGLKEMRSRYNGRVFISWLQDSDDKWERIKHCTLLRHLNEAEALHAVQTMNWEARVAELKASGEKLTNEEWQMSTKIHVAMVEVSDHFETGSH